MDCCFVGCSLQGHLINKCASFGVCVCGCLIRYTLCYVYEPRFEVGGGFWPHALKWIIRTMYLSQAFMLCVFVLRE